MLSCNPLQVVGPPLNPQFFVFILLLLLLFPINILLRARGSAGVAPFFVSAPEAFPTPSLLRKVTRAAPFGGVLLSSLNKKKKNLPL